MAFEIGARRAFPLRDAHVTVSVQDLRVLVVEDEYLIAQQEVDFLEESGCVIVGPVPGPERALRMVERERIDVALLNINLGGEMAFPVALELAGRHIPFAFVTGYSRSILPPQLAAYPLARKPFTRQSLLVALQEALLQPAGGPLRGS
jgi:DNA-binding response OmpR family regulator